MVTVYRMPGELPVFALVTPLRPAVVVAVDSGGQLFSAQLPPKMNLALHRVDAGKALPEDEGIRPVSYNELPRPILLCIARELAGWVGVLDALVLSDRQSAALTVDAALERKWIAHLGERCDQEGFVVLSDGDGGDLVVARRRWVQVGNMALTTSSPKVAKDSARDLFGTGDKAADDDDTTIQ